MATRVPLPAGWGEAWLHDAGSHQPKDNRSARAYDHRGRQLVWLPPVTDGRVACDIENSHGRPVSEIALRFGVCEHEFRRRWVVAEVQAKLADVPVLLWLKQHGLPAAPFDDVQGCVCEVGTTSMAFGMLSRQTPLITTAGL